MYTKEIVALIQKTPNTAKPFTAGWTVFGEPVEQSKAAASRILLYIL